MNGETRILKCSACGADLHRTSDRETFFCQFCGAKQTLEDDSHHKVTYRSVDDARIREADVHETIRLRELDVELLRLQNEMLHKRFTLLARLVCIIAYFLIFAGIMFLPDSDSSGMTLRGWLLFYIPFGVFLFIFMFRKGK